MVGHLSNSISKSCVSRREAAGSADARQGEATTTRMILKWNKDGHQSYTKTVVSLLFGHRLVLHVIRSSRSTGLTA
jgi:hypothetical protein